MGECSSGTGLTSGTTRVVPDKGPLNGCVYVCVYRATDCVQLTE